MTVTVYSRTVNGKKGKWEFHSTYMDGMPGGKKREKEYPSIADQLDDIYHNGIDGWKATIKTTKDKYPKE